MPNLFDLFGRPEPDPEPTEEEKFVKRLENESSLSKTAKAILANLNRKKN